jgi:hypothetical protein
LEEDVTGCQIRGVRRVWDDSHFLYRQKPLDEDGSVRRGVAMVKQPGLFSPKFARFHAVAAKCRTITRNSQFGLLGPVLRAQLLYGWRHQSGIFWIPPRNFLYNFCLNISHSKYIERDMINNVYWSLC